MEIRVLKKNAFRLEDCQKACTETPECLAFAWVRSGNLTRTCFRTGWAGSNVVEGNLSDLLGRGGRGARGTRAEKHAQKGSSQGRLPPKRLAHERVYGEEP